MPTHHLKPLACILLCLSSSPSFADVYEYIDEEGVVHLTDAPGDDRYVLILKSEVIASTPDPTTTATTTANLQLSLPADSATNLTSSLAPNLTANLTPSQLTAQIAQSASNNQLDSELIHAVIHVESAFKTQATSHKGAQGLMQLMPATATRLGVNNSYDPVQNIEGGAKYLRQLLTLFNNDISLAIAAYNAGEHAVIRYGYKIPPYKETQAYVPKVLNIYKALMKQRQMQRQEAQHKRAM